MRTQLFKAFTGVAGVYHVGLGLVGLLCPVATLTKMTEVFLGVAPKIDAQFGFIAKFAAVYVLSFGVTLLILASNPEKYRVLLVPVLALFGIRLLNKIIFFGSISSAFDMSQGRSLFGLISIIIFLVAFLCTMPRKEQ